MDTIDTIECEKKMQDWSGVASDDINERSQKYIEKMKCDWFKANEVAFIMR